MKTAPRLPRDLRHALNRIAASRARAAADVLWRRERDALIAAALDMLIGGRSTRDVLDELAAPR